MKRLAVLILALFLSYIVYYDFSTGTLPTSATPAQDSSTSSANQKTIETNNNYYEVKIKEGDTVMSIIERTHSSSLSVSIETIISDFEKLNPGKKADSITIGSTYKFQKYTN